MVGNDDLRHRRHAHSITTQHTIHLIFGRSLESWSLYSYIDAVRDTYLTLPRYNRSLLYKVEVISLVHVGETRTCREVLSPQRMLREHVDMVCNYHEIANLECGVHAAGSIRHEKGLYAQLIHHPDRECHLLHGVALVEMKTSLHGKDIHSTEFSEDQLSAVTFYR